MEIVYLLLALSAGSVIGYFFHKSKSSSLITERELLRQENENLKSQKQDFEELKEESMKAAKAAMLEASNQMSSKLLEDHKRENELSKKQAEEVAKKETEKLNKEFVQIVDKLSSLQGHMNRQDNKLSSVWQALASPAGAGSYAEIGLENTLKSFGLEQGRDFHTQYTVNYEGGRLRPDAVVLLPSGNLMVIDSKSSKFFLEIAQASADDEDKLLIELKKTMDRHLNDLAARDYKNAVRKNHNNADGTIINVMYLPNEAALQKVFKADPEFRNKCYKKDIILTDPSGLQLLLNIATHEIARAKQEHNYKLILQEMGKVISSLDMFLRHTESVGKSIRISAEHYSKLSKSVNARLLGRIKRVLDLGVLPEKEAKLPDSLPDYNVTENEIQIVDSSDQAKVPELEEV